MPQAIINQFEKQYPGRGKSVFYATANKEGRDPETFKLKGKKPRRPKATGDKAATLKHFSGHR